MPNTGKELKQKFDNLKEQFSTAYTRSQIEAFLGELSTLQLEAASYGLNFDISHLQEIAEAKIKNFEAEQSINRFQVQEEEFLKVQKAKKLAEEEKEVIQKILVLNNFHNNFMENIDKNIKKIKEDNIHYDHVINKLEKEKIIDHEKLDSKLLTHEEILLQHKKHKEYYEHQKRINEEHTRVNQELNELNKTITNIKQQLQKKDLTPEEINELKQKLEFHQKMLKMHKPYAERLNEAKKETDHKITQYEKDRKAQGEKIEKLGSAIKVHHKKEPEKYSKAHIKYVALRNQHEAISTNGIVKDIEHHNMVLSKINSHKNKSLADKMKEQATVNNSIRNLYPFCTPSTNSANNKMRGL